MKQEFDRFDMKRPPVRTKWYLRPLTYILSAPDTFIHRTKIIRTGTEGLKPPYLMLCNHNAFLDFKVATRTIFPHRANYVVAIDGFIGREELLRNVGCICKRKFTNDVTLIRHLRQVMRNGDVLVLYPEARYSLCGTTAVLPGSLGKFCPRGARGGEKPPLVRRTLSHVSVALRFGRQKERGIRTPYAKRAEGLHKVLYQCPACGTEFRMASKGTRLFCEACGKSWTMSELGELSADTGETEFPHIPDWYEWERANVRAQVEAGNYSSGVLPVTVDTLPNAKKFVRLGEGTLVHDMNGFTVRGTDTDGDPFEMIKNVPSLYSCHIEYEYLGKHGDCVDLNTLEDTWYIYPHDCDFSVTKMALATEELYFAYREKIGRPCPKGLA